MSDLIKGEIELNNHKICILKKELQSHTTLQEALKKIDEYNEIKGHKPYGGKLFIVMAQTDSLPMEVSERSLTGEISYLRQEMRKLNERNFNLRQEMR